MTSFIVTLFRPAPIMSTTVNKSVYTPEWAERLYRGVARNFHAPFRFVCITDHDEQDFSRNIEVWPFCYKPHVGTWMCLMEMMRGDLMLDNAIAMGLDTIITGDITGLAEHGSPFAMVRAPVRSVTAWNPVALFRNAGWLWEEYMQDPQAAAEASKYLRWARHQGSELLYWAKMVPNHALIDEVCPDVKIASYKHEREACPEASIVYFQGSYKPDAAEEGWAKRNWI